MPSANVKPTVTAKTREREQPELPFAAPHVYVIVVADSRDPRSAHRVSRAETVIGRDPAADLRLEDEQVSKKHCTIRVQGAVCNIIDHDSLNGTWVNRKQLRGGMAQRLRHLDEIEVGDTKLLYLGGKITGPLRPV